MAAEDTSPTSSLASPSPKAASSPRASAPTSHRTAPPGVQDHELGSEAEREKNRKLLKDLHNEHKEMGAWRKKFEQDTAAKVKQLLDQTAKLTSQNAKLTSEIAVLKREVLGTREQKKALQDTQKDIQRLKDGTQSEHEITRIEAKSDLANMQLRALRQQLLDRGVLAPKREEPPEPEELPPVGTLELGEDVFTARLLMRLGFMKGAKQLAAQERALGTDTEEDASSVDSFSLNHEAEENVSGLVIPDVEGGRFGRLFLTWGWFAVCLFTFVVQLTILAIMLEHGLDMGGTACFTEPPDVRTWWALHISKGLAMLVAGVLMGKELMDIVNYWMVGDLLLPANHIKEATFIAVLRVMMAAVIMCSNIAIFMNLTNPADIWLNMTALGFVSTLGEDVLSVARRGVFGHTISKTITNLNFELTFVTEYPNWFEKVRQMVLAISATVIVVSSYFSFNTADVMCE